MNSNFKLYEWKAKLLVNNPAIVYDNGKIHAFRQDGTLYLNSGYKTDENWKEATLTEVLFRFRIDVRPNVIKSLESIGYKLKPIKKIRITKKLRAEIIDELTKNRAHNGDSAYKFPDDKQDILYFMVKKKLIGFVAGRHYLVDKEEINH